jgi:hypothetical protein
MLDVRHALCAVRPGYGRDELGAAEAACGRQVGRTQ